MDHILFKLVKKIERPEFIKLKKVYSLLSFITKPSGEILNLFVITRFR